MTDLTEVITSDKLSRMAENAQNKDEVSYLNYKTKTDEDGKITAEKIESVCLTFIRGKFRFTYKTGTITLSLLTVSFAFVCSAFIIATSLIELLFAKVDVSSSFCF
ncbi:hypothetical protein NWO25_16230 [Enterococcus lactis]|nr:hypothetical protein [Enterococcus lactis]